jgi:hypothetical protein
MKIYSVTEYALGALMACLLISVAVLGIFYSLWVFVGSGAFFFSALIWIRIETGRWVDNLFTVELSLPRAALKCSQPQRLLS